MTPAETIARLVREKNEALDKEAKVEYGIGAVFTLLVFGAIFALTWLVGLMADQSMLFSVGLTFALFALSAFVAWKTVAPQRQLHPMDSPREVVDLLSGSTPAALFFHPRHELPGGAGFLMSGPESLLKAFGIQQNKLPDDPALHDRAAKLLSKCQEGYPLKRMKQPAAVILVRQLGLVRVERRDAGPTLVLTDTGRVLVDQM